MSDDLPTPSFRAEQITPGVRWTRGDRFQDDPDVSELYAELCATGMLTIARQGDRLDWRSQPKTIDALVRRAAEDGFAAGFSDYPLRRVWLTGPLRPEQADPWPQLHDEAAALYAQLRHEGQVVLGISYGESGHALAGFRANDTVLLDLVGELAAADSMQLSIDMLGDCYWHLTLPVRAGRQPGDAPARVPAGRRSPLCQ